jgi:predicted transposase/invertase (TIGR01784 family)
LNFTFPKGEFPDDSYRHEVVLMDKEFKQVFYDKLTFIYLEMPKFNKTEDELDGLFEKWMFVLKNLYRLLERPAALQEKVFTMLFDAAEIARFTPEERWAYEESVKNFRDNKNTVDTSYMKGKTEEKLTTAQRMKAKGYPVEDIAEITGLTSEQIEKL